MSVMYYICVKRNFVKVDAIKYFLNELKYVDKDLAKRLSTEIAFKMILAQSIAMYGEYALVDNVKKLHKIELRKTDKAKEHYLRQNINIGDEWDSDEFVQGFEAGLDSIIEALREVIKLEYIEIKDEL